MKRLILSSACAALLLAPVATEAASDASARLAGGRGFVALRVDAAAGEVHAVVMANLGELESVVIRRGNQNLLNLSGLDFNEGSASGTVNTNTNLAQLEANPNAFTVEVSGSDGSASSRLKLNGEANVPNAAPIDLANVGTTAAKNGRVAARIRNRSQADSTPTSVAFYLSEDNTLSNDDQKILETAVGSIRGGRKQKVAVKITWPEDVRGEQVFVIGEVDGAGVNNDPNEGNNVDATNGAVNVPD